MANLFCAAIAMSEASQLPTSREESLKSIEGEINQLRRKADDAWQAYQEAGIWKRTSARVYWAAAVRDNEAARREKEALLAIEKALMEKLPTGGITSAAGSDRMSHSQRAHMYRAHASHMSPYCQTCWTASKQAVFA